MGELAAASDGFNGRSGMRDFALPPDIRAHIGRILASTYDATRSSSAALPELMRDLLIRLTTILAKQADCDAETFHAEFLAFMPNLRRFALSLT